MSRVPISPLFRFHASSGARVASRNGIIGVCAIVFAIGSAPEPLLLLRALARGVAAQGFGPGPLIGLVAVAYVLAREAVPRLTLGLGGWLRSLPVDGVAHRRGVVAGLTIVQIPLACAVVLAAALVALVYRDALSLAKLTGAAVGLVAVGAAVVPSRRGFIAIPPALGAAVLAALGDWLALGAAVVLLRVSDRVAGPLRLPVRTGGRRSADRTAGLPMYRFTWRALGWRIAAPLPIAALAIAAGWFYSRNNELSQADTAFIARLWGVIALTIYVGAVADLVAARRPVWPWARSLAWSSTDRVIDDAIAIGLPALVVALAVAVIHPGGVLVTIAVLPALALLAAGAIPRARNRITRVSGLLLLVGVPLAAAGAYMPWWSLAALASTTIALRIAAWRERRALVTGWRELYHDAAGDSLSWSAR